MNPIEVQAREPRPLAVRREQLGRLVALDPAAAQPRHQLHRAQDRRRARARRPRPSRQTTPADHGRARVHARCTPPPPPRERCSRSRSTDRQIRTSAAAPRMQPEPAEPRRRKPRERRDVGGSRRRVPHARPKRATIRTSSSRAWRESISCPQNARNSARDRRKPQLAHPLKPPRRLADQRVAREAAEGTRCGRRRSARRNGAARDLPRLSARRTTRPSTAAYPAELDALADAQRSSSASRHGASASRRSHGGGTGRERERTGGTNDPLERQRAGLKRSRRPRRDRRRGGGWLGLVGAARSRRRLANSSAAVPASLAGRARFNRSIAR